MLKALLALLLGVSCLHASRWELSQDWKAHWYWSQGTEDSATLRLPHLFEHQGRILYSQTVRLPDTAGLWALYIPAPMNQAELWINQSLVASKLDRESLHLLPRDGKAVHITLQVSNDATALGGMPQAPLLGPAVYLLELMQFRRALLYLFAGILFLMALYHLMLLKHKSHQQGNLIFALLSLVGVYRLLGSGHILADLFPAVPWDAWLRLDFASNGLFFALLYLFVDHALPGRLERAAGLASVCLYMAYALAMALVPLEWLHPTSPYFLALSLLGVFYVVQAELQALLARRSIRHCVLLVTTLIFIATLYNDLLCMAHAIEGSFLAPMGLMPLVIGHWLTLAQEYGRSFTQAEKRLDEFMRAMAKAISSKSLYTGQHIERVTRISLRIAQAMGLAQAQQRQIYLGAVVHDLGKIHLPDEILDKPEELNPSEMALVRSHPMQGWEMLHHVEGLDIPRLIIRHHHENWDGSGYPDQLAGEEIPLEARIVALADHWEAMTSSRAHRGALPNEIVLKLLEAEAGRKLDPALVHLFLAQKLWEEKTI